VGSGFEGRSSIILLGLSALSGHLEPGAFFYPINWDLEEHRAMNPKTVAFLGGFLFICFL